ncbi:predicted nucleic acid-binding protein, containing PIN domain [Thermococcus kodakarensis KOD1]|uniref:Predicted nucleic acid-binding protein, containing PIN domain n=1 Tax=Thermococcus kodakarensis (strain ATCC BAA-918 / JCM 12380 / KOD1) TaxID=69014 RepID=Q5JGQ3_THEKO|nr:type II toxin-antitoxin system VapC family toxin [Thermococcus kodakarensis]WCN27281.1 type II toxin-antitoxin system VapC family toxin [Thermococcus kodakarensis]WCN29568.1 type II toxin-antitoxin system VapC family toxin [Thermococcus kodakarensis]BAD85479.1 predicted nucleic acid-binding protein, containing PIN domain [Thermococcus kodakarensis KOD1]
MRFIDANVFLYAVIKPKGEVPSSVLERKKKAREILTRIENGEEVATTVVHLSEVANILEAKLNLTIALEFIEDLLTAENVIVLPVATEDYLKAILIARDKGVSVNDALAYLKMRELDINEIYTFDRHFLNLDVKIVEE